MNLFSEKIDIAENEDIGFLDRCLWMWPALKLQGSQSSVVSQLFVALTAFSFAVMARQQERSRPRRWGREEAFESR